MRDTTRLASSPAGTWRDVTATNVDALRRGHRRPHPALQRLKTDFTDGLELEHVFDDAASWKRTLDEFRRTSAANHEAEGHGHAHVSRDDGPVARCALARVPVSTIAGDARREPCEPEFWRYLYSTVGEAYRWVDRLPWSEDEIRAYLDDPAVSLWVMTVDDAIAGYFELRMRTRTRAWRSSISGCCRSSPDADSADFC